jgi:cytochrome P450
VSALSTKEKVADLVATFKSTGRIVIVGASLAGLRAAEALRKEGFTGQLTIIGDEATIPKGAPIIVLYASGNRDPSRFTNPDEVDLEREHNEHLGYGGGIHLCFGGPLARLEAQIAVSEFVRRVQNPRLVVDPPPYRHNQIFRGPRHVPVDIDGVRD